MEIGLYANTHGLGKKVGEAFVLQPPGSAGGLPGRPHSEFLASQKSSCSTGFYKVFRHGGMPCGL